MHREASCTRHTRVKDLELAIVCESSRTSSVTNVSIIIIIFSRLFLLVLWDFRARPGLIPHARQQKTTTNKRLRQSKVPFGLLGRSTIVDPEREPLIPLRTSPLFATNRAAPVFLDGVVGFRFCHHHGWG